MQPPMVGSWTILIQAVRPFTIHGDLYYELHAVRTDDPGAADQLLALRVPQHATSRPPQPGDRVSVTFLMGQITQVTPETRIPKPESPNQARMQKPE